MAIGNAVDHVADRAAQDQGERQREKPLRPCRANRNRMNSAAMMATPMRKSAASRGAGQEAEGGALVVGQDRLKKPVIAVHIA